LVNRLPRQATAIQGWILVSCAWLSVIANQAIAPMLPTMTKVFRDQPHVDLLIALTATGPALGTGLLAAMFGFLGDRLGHQRILFASTLVYGLMGTAPIWLATLPAIVATRGLVGVSEAGVMACSTALICNYFIGRTRERYLALQTGTSSIVSALVTLVGGALGESGWRYPFYVYGFAFVLIPLTGLFLWEPRQPTTEPGTVSPSEQPADRFSWSWQLWTSLVSVLAMMVFLVTAIQTSFLLTERGLASPQSIGRWQSLTMIANPLGSLAFAVLKGRPLQKITAAFFLMGIGQWIMATVSGWPTTLIGVAIANFGAGLILPALGIWALASVPAAHRGAASGVWIAAIFVGQFLSPVSILGLKWLTGSLSHAIFVYSATSIAAALFGLACLRRATRPA
jgi:MFS family permease